jgi:ABC-2 type transport system permease protein
MRPLLFFGVLYVVFTQIFNIGAGTPHYGVYLLTSIVLWTYLAEATGGCVQCLVQREAMLRKIRFPRMVIPLSVSLTSLFNLAMNFIAVLAFAVADGISPAFSWLWLIPIVLGFVTLATGLGMLLAALYVRFRDMQPIWDVALQAWFYCSPVMYTAVKYESLSVNFKHWAMVNPAATLLTQMGHAFIDPHAPAKLSPVARAAGGYGPVIIAVALIPATFALGWWFFTHEAPRVAENL